MALGIFSSGLASFLWSHFQVLINSSSSPIKEISWLGASVNYNFLQRWLSLSLSESRLLLFSFALFWLCCRYTDCKPHVAYRVTPNFILFLILPYLELSLMIFSVKIVTVRLSLLCCIINQQGTVEKMKAVTGEEMEVWASLRRLPAPVTSHISAAAQLICHKASATLASLQYASEEVTCSSFCIKENSDTVLKLLLS